MGRARYVPAEDDRHISLREATALVGLSKETLRDRCLAGDIPFQIVGRRRTVKVADLKDFMARAQAKAEALVAASQQQKASSAARSSRSPRPVPVDAVKPITLLRKRGKAA
jgi:excisionase family DNA binding protein